MAEESSFQSPHNMQSDENGIEGGGNEDNSNVQEQDQFIPIANVRRIMKKALPGNAKIAKDAEEKMQECVLEFIYFVRDKAIEKCKREKRQTVNGDDMLWAMSSLGFDDYVDILKICLDNYREIEGGYTGSTIMDKPKE